MSIRTSHPGRRAGPPIHRRIEHYRLIWRVLSGRAPTHRRTVQ